MKMLNHKNIIKLYKNFVIKNQLLLIMEYADGGELIHYVEETKGLEELECRQLFKQMLGAIEACHEQGIIHRDLKLENVLFESKTKTRIKIVDFGISGRCKGNTAEKTDAGTIRYMAPEVLDGSDIKANPAIDLWALGVMLYCMRFYKFPFTGDTSEQIKHKILTNEVRIPKDTPASEDFCDLVRGLLNKEPSKRSTLYQVKTHKWMLLSDSAINLKVTLAKQNFEREKEQKAEEEEKRRD